MGYAAHHRDIHLVVGSEADPVRRLAKERGWLRQMFDAFMESRQRSLDREVARFLAARSGGVLTDSLEREMWQRLSTSNWSPNIEPHTDRRFP
jgi:hypothetical protein